MYTCIEKVQHTPNACASCCYNMHMPNSSLTTPTNFRRYCIPTCSLYKHKMSYKLDSPSHPHICVSKYEIHKSCSTSWHVYSCGDTVVVLQVWWNYPEGVCTRHHILPITFPFRWTTSWRPWAVNIESLLTSGCGLSYKCMEDKYKDTWRLKTWNNWDMLSLMLAWAKNDLRGIISGNG